jgi:DNA-binding CsgD family transcriptional regulator
LLGLGSGGVTGKSNAEIADKMCLSFHTVSNYRQNLTIKPNVHNTAELMKVAIEEKLECGKGVVFGFYLYLCSEAIK